MPPVMPVTRIMSDNEIYGIHERGDCYINASRGEGWCWPVFDALALGKSVITNNYGGMADYVSPENAILYGGTITNVYNSPHPEPFLYSGLSRWFEPSTAHMADVMRNFHLLRRGNTKHELTEENQALWNKLLTLRKDAAGMAAKFDYRKVAKMVTKHFLAAAKSWKESGKVMFARPETIHD
jgi:glycosyltransferase involved in cell wall biosynthesis